MVKKLNFIISVLGCLILLMFPLSNLNVDAEENDQNLDVGESTEIIYKNQNEELVFLEDEFGNPFNFPESNVSNGFHFGILTPDPGLNFYRISSTLVSTENKTKTNIICDGQPAQGTRITGGGSIIINDSAGATMTASFGLSWGSVSVSFPVGKKANAGISVNIPANNYFYKVKVDKKYEFKRYREVWRDDTGQQLTIYAVTKKLLSNSFHADRV